MKFFTSAFVLVAFLALGFSQTHAGETNSCDPASVDMSAAKLDELSVAMQGFINNETLAGAAALIARNGQIVYRENFGFADRKAQRPIDDTTIFRIASMTKLVVTVATYQLIEDGVIAKDTPLSQFVPAFANPTVIESVANEPPSVYNTRLAATEINIDHLLDHTSGLEYRFHNHPILGPLYAENSIWDGFNVVPEDGPATVGDLVANRLANLPLLFDPGDQFNYSLSHDVLGYLIEQVTGQKLSNYLQQNIFNPLEMNSTFFFTQDPDEIDRMAVVYTPDGNGGLTELGRQPVELFPNFFADGGYTTEGPQAVFSGGAGLSATLDDYFRFAQMLANGGKIKNREGTNTVRILKNKTVKELLTVEDSDPFMDPFTNYFGWSGYKFNNGAGVHVDQDLSHKNNVSLGQVSWNGAFNTFFFIDPQEHLVGIMMAQKVPFDYTKAQATFERLTYEALTERYGN